MCLLHQPNTSLYHAAVMGVLTKISKSMEGERTKRERETERKREREREMERETERDRKRKMEREGGLAELVVKHSARGYPRLGWVMAHPWPLRGGQHTASPSRPPPHQQQRHYQGTAAHGSRSPPRLSGANHVIWCNDRVMTQIGDVFSFPLLAATGVPCEGRGRRRRRRRRREG